MAHIKIEMDRGNGWEIRSEGDATATAEQVAASLPSYAIQYPHRAWLDGVLIATVQPKSRKNPKHGA